MDTPFPPEDTEAQEFARVRYLMKYYFHNFGDLDEIIETLGYGKEAKELENALELNRNMWDTINSYPYGARKMDLMKLTWPFLSSKAPVSDGYGGIIKYPSNYFYDLEMRDRLKRVGAWDE